MKLSTNDLLKLEVNIMGMKCNPVLLIVCLLIGSIIGCFVLCSCARFSLIESYNNIGSNVNYNIKDGVDKSWDNNLEVSDNTAESSIIPSHLLSKTMNIFNETKFSQDCCPSMYSTSDGCACNIGAIQDFINKRGNNRSSCDLY